MDLRPRPVRTLLDHLRRLPGVGPRSAHRLVDYLLTCSEVEVEAMAASLAGLRQSVRLCSTCSLLTDQDPCAVCADSGRDRSIILVLEEPTTAWAVEATGAFRGVYHALLGHLSPLHGVGPEDLTVEQLLARAATEEVREVILATDPTVEGETTAVYLAGRLRPLGVHVTRPASGIPVGGEVAAVDQATLAQALQLRHDL